MRQIVLDTETTGLFPEQGHRIIEIGCVEIIDRKITSAQFHHYINPERDIDSEALEVHGLTRDFLSDKPLFSAVHESLLAFIQDSELIIHNAPFDVGFLNHEFSLIQSGIKIENMCQITDSLIMARNQHVGQRNSLDALCKRYMVDNTHRGLHGALLDAHLLARVYLAMTGGQATLFGVTDEAEAEKHKTIITSQQNQQDLALQVIKANVTELADHEDYLAFLAKKTECVWSNLG
jgi:DNA polymerase-3 subunit epsilon